MIRTLLTTTAVALLLSAPAMAQNNAAQPADPNTKPMATDNMAPGGDMNLLSRGYMAAENDHLVSRLMGQPVYSSAADDAEQIGDINDLVLTENGDIGAVVIGVGGFLGIGEKNVAVDYNTLQWTTAADNSQRLVLPTTKDELTAAAEFTWPEQNDQGANTDMAANNNMATPAPAATSTTTLPADQTAQATTPAPAVTTTTLPADQTNVAANPNPNGAVTQGMQNAQDTAANPNASPLDYNAMTPVDPSALTTADEIIGTKVVGPDNQQIAEVGDIVLTQDGQIDALLVDFGGFLGIGEKRVAVGMDNLRFVSDANGNKYVFVNATKEQLDAAPAYDEANYATNRDSQRLVVTN